jgi:hypothetical protein
VAVVDDRVDPRKRARRGTGAGGENSWEAVVDVADASISGVAAVVVVHWTVVKLQLQQ